MSCSVHIQGVVSLALNQSLVVNFVVLLCLHTRRHVLQPTNQFQACNFLSRYAVTKMSSDANHTETSSHLMSTRQTNYP